MGQLPEENQTFFTTPGHSFGAHHDDSFPNPECRAHLMSAQSAKTAASRSYEFSFCSKRLIAATIAGMGYCLLEEDKPFCGNGKVYLGVYFGLLP